LICAGDGIAYYFPIRYAPYRVVRIKTLRASWSSISEGHERKCRTISAYFFITENYESTIADKTQDKNSLSSCCVLGNALNLINAPLCETGKRTKTDGALLYQVVCPNLLIDQSPRQRREVCWDI